MQEEQASQQRPAAGEDSMHTDEAQRCPATGETRVDEAQRCPATGETRVDEALASLDELAGLPVTEHPAVFEQVHRRLREVLGELDTEESAGSPAGPGTAGTAGPAGPAGAAGPAGPAGAAGPAGTAGPGVPGSPDRPGEAATQRRPGR
jgi:hypothetical protein